ncbi:unnamed protein product [Rhizoctonia solani]|uniref:Major facilitator superfamily (MFS) profile domain-containing protein n=1 Tax=Rhizoctonia solani TaxID=456999 RepID=A0A8H3BPE7_9AGAM|nr:unnamed protein product [Rhizoctonia solani]
MVGFVPSFSVLIFIASNWLGAIIYLGYLLFAFPQNIALQYAPVGKWISLNVSIWGIAMVLQSLRLPFFGLLACRFVLGVCEGSITSGFLMITSMFYTKNEQSSRVGYWFLMNGTAQIISNLMGYGSLYFRSNLLAPWQWFTLINGVLTFATALAFYLYFPDSILTARFLTEEEKIIATERVSEHETNIESKGWKKEHLIVESLGFSRLQTTLLGTLDGVIEIITIYTGVNYYITLVEQNWVADISLFNRYRNYRVCSGTCLGNVKYSWTYKAFNLIAPKRLCSRLIVPETSSDLICGRKITNPGTEYPGSLLEHVTVAA